MAWNRGLTVSSAGGTDLQVPAIWARARALASPAYPLDRACVPRSMHRVTRSDSRRFSSGAGRTGLCSHAVMYAISLRAGPGDRF